MTELVTDKKKIRFLKELFFKNSDKTQIEEFMKKLKTEVTKEKRERKKLIKIIRFYTDRKYINLNNNRDLIEHTTDELLDIIEEITEMTRKLI